MTNKNFKHKKSNKMKKIITIAVIAASSFLTAASAQKTSFGFNGGITMSSYKTKSGDETFTSKLRTGFSLGFVTDIPLSKSVSLQPALQYTQKGGVETGTVDYQDYKQTTTFNYLDIPVNLIYKTNSAHTKFYIGAGPSVAFGINGLTEYESGDKTSTDNIKFGNGEDDDVKGLDLGANMLAGVLFKSGVSISMNYNMGFSNLVIGGNKDFSAHNRSWGLRVGYMLKGKKA
jgi:hypothetical protein